MTKPPLLEEVEDSICCADNGLENYGDMARAAMEIIWGRLSEPSEDILMAAQRSTSGWLNLERHGSGLTQALMKHRVRWLAMLSRAKAEAEGRE